MDSTTGATGRQRARNAVLGALEHHAKDDAALLTEIQRKIISRPGWTHDQEPRRSALTQAQQAADTIRQQADEMQHRAVSDAERTQRQVLNHAERTARTHLLLAAETLAVALSLAASAYLLVQAGQYLGLTYGVRAYQAWTGAQHE